MQFQKFLIASILACCFVVPAFAAGKQEQEVRGLVDNMIQTAQPAVDFTLTDQDGNPFHMAGQRGKVVVMGFIYTHCTDLCPYVAAKMKEAWQLLGPDAKDVVFVAVTTDPKRDVPPVTMHYSKAFGMEGVWHFVGGPAKAVQAVWASYGIGVTVNPATDAVAVKEETGAGNPEQPPTRGLSASDVALATKIIQQFGGGYDVGHSAPFWIVDKKGMIRVGMDANATPADIATNVRVLLKVR